MEKRKLFTVFILFVYFISTYAQSFIDRNYRIKDSDNIISKNFYLTYLLSEDLDAKILLEQDTILQRIARKKYSLIEKSDNLTFIDASVFTQDDIELIANRLKQLYRIDNALGYIVSKHIKPSGTYGIYTDLPDNELLAKIWKQDAIGINNIIDIYGRGTKSRYPQIDSISYDINSSAFKNLITECKQYIINYTKGSDLFCTIPVITTLTLLDINDRYEAIDYEPLSETVNKTSYDRVNKINWKSYSYAALLVLGSGPEEYNIQLSAEGKLRLRTAAIKFHQGFAPFIIVSGGRVHPYKTPNNESFYMKDFLIKKCNVPENAIIMEPHARHTTTNIRNAARIIFRNSFPQEKLILLAVSSSTHIDYVCSQLFIDRCMNEMGIIPFIAGKRIDSNNVELRLRDNSLYINPIDPLDP